MTPFFKCRFAKYACLWPDRSAIAEELAKNTNDCERNAPRSSAFVRLRDHFRHQNLTVDQKLEKVLRWHPLKCLLGPILSAIFLKIEGISSLNNAYRVTKFCANLKYHIS